MGVPVLGVSGVCVRWRCLVVRNCTRQFACPDCVGAQPTCTARVPRPGVGSAIARRAAPFFFVCVYFLVSVSYTQANADMLTPGGVPGVWCATITHPWCAGLRPGLSARWTARRLAIHCLNTTRYAQRLYQNEATLPHACRVLRTTRQTGIAGHRYGYGTRRTAHRAPRTAALRCCAWLAVRAWPCAPRRSISATWCWQYICFKIVR